jgi:hypothetical protein
MGIMFFLVAMKRLLKILSWMEEIRGRDVPIKLLEICRYNFWEPGTKQAHVYRHLI